MLGKLKKTAPETLWEVYLGAMKKAYDRHLDQAGAGSTPHALPAFRDLAHKISQVRTVPVGYHDLAIGAHS
eukprot:3781752-Pyramimonas_sp.AAC.1